MRVNLNLKGRLETATKKADLMFVQHIVASLKNNGRAAVVMPHGVFHELAHLLESNHTSRFWNIVAVQVPNYQTAKNWLRDNGNMLEEDF